MGNSFFRQEEQAASDAIVDHVLPTTVNERQAVAIEEEGGLQVDEDRLPTETDERLEDPLSDDVIETSSSKSNGGIPILGPVLQEFRGVGATAALQEARGYIENFAGDNGFCVSIASHRTSNSAKYSRETCKLVLICSASGSYRPHRSSGSAGNVVSGEIKARPNQRTIKKECPFKVEIYNQNLGSSRCQQGRNQSSTYQKNKKKELSNVYCIDVIDGSHNHDKFQLSTLPKYRKQSLIERHGDLIMNEINHGSTNMDIAKRMRKDDEERGDIIGIYDPRDLASIRQSMKKVNRCGEIDSVAAMFKRIHEGDLKEFWISEQKQDEHGMLTHAFFMPRSAIKLAQVFGHVNISDCTFQTNRHSFPLLDICVVTAESMTITVAFGLLKKDEVTEIDYVWILQNYRRLVFTENISLPGVWVIDREVAFYNALKVVFPDTYIIICFWHIEKAIEGHLKSQRSDPRITADKWYVVVTIMH
jgi:hypothetical protein